METGGRQVAGFASAEAQESSPCAKPELNSLIGGRGRIDGAVRHSRRNRRSAHRAQQPALKCLRIRRIRSHQIGHAARQDVAEQAEAGAQHRLRRDLPGDGRSGLQDRQRRRGEDVAQVRLDQLRSAADSHRARWRRTNPAGAPRRRADSADWNCSVSRTPKVQVSVRVTFQVSCA